MANENAIRDDNNVPALVLDNGAGETVGAKGDSSGNLKIALQDGSGNPLSSFRGALDVHGADTHRSIVNSFFHRDNGVLSTTLSADANIGDTTITLTSVTGLNVSGGDILHIDNRGIFVKTLSVAGNVVTIDAPVDFLMDAGTNVHTIEINFSSTAGTLASPVSYKITPPAGTIWHIVRILPTMILSSAPDDGLFGNGAALTNGVVLRRYDGATGTTSTFTNWKDNSSIRSDMYDLTFTTRSGGGGSYGISGRGTFKKIGSVVYLDADAGDYLEILIQDNLTVATGTGLVRFEAKAQGHVEGI